MNEGEAVKEHPWLLISPSWCSLIADPLFISAHLNHQSTAGRRTVLVRPRDAIGEMIRYTLNSDDDSLTDIAEFGNPFPNPHSCPRILGVVNGLICLLIETNRLMLWNPAIRKFQNLPDPVPGLIFPSPPRFGFGFDPLANDYKVVRIDYGSTGTCVRVYRLSAGSWSRIELNWEAFDLPSLFPRQAYLNGVVHWIGSDSTIVGFDIRTENFRVCNCLVIERQENGRCRNCSLVWESCSV